MITSFVSLSSSTGQIVNCLIEDTRRKGHENIPTFISPSIFYHACSSATKAACSKNLFKLFKMLLTLRFNHYAQTGGIVKGV